MVDINLFKEGEEEMEWESSGDMDDQPSNDDVSAGIPEDPSKNLDDDFGDDFDFDQEEFDEADSLDDDSFLDDHDGEGELEPLKDEDEFEEEDYDFGDSKEKKVSVWLILVLGLVVILAAVYFLWYQPKMKKIKQPVVTSSRTVAPRTAQSPVQKDTTATETVGGDTVQAETPPVVTQQTAIAGTSNNTRILVQPIKTVVQNLSNTGQFGSVIVTGNRFFVEYVSDSPNVSDAMAYKIKTLLNVSDVKKSPEEKYNRGGKVRYSGVISGVIPGAPETLKPIGSARYSSKNDFINQMKQLAQQYGMVYKSAKTLDSEKDLIVQMKVEGNQSKAIQFLDALGGKSGNYAVSKVLMVPKEYSDFNASTVRVVIDFVYFQ